jgi:hypothetical protein
MTRSLARILLAVLLVPSAAAVYLIVWLTVEVMSWRWRLYGDRGAYLVAGAVTWVFAGSFWLLLWRKSVRWSVPRVAWTALAVLLAVLLAATLAVACGVLTEDRGFGYFLASVLAPLFWLIGTVCVWRETADERRQRLQGTGSEVVVCPKCSYNMAGLGEARCPECGSRFTLDQLIAEQPARADGEIQ